MKQHHRQGYILFMTFSMLALCTALISVALVKGIVHKKIASVILEQERIERFAYSVPALAQSFLSFSAADIRHVGQDAAAATVTQNTPADGDSGFGRLLLEKIVPVLHHKQVFNFESIEKDFPVVINLTFFAESGKININGLYDLLQKKFYDEGVAGKDRKVFATWLFTKIAKITGKKSLLQPFVDHVKNRKAPFNDVVELLSIPEFSECFGDAVFYAHHEKKDTEQSTEKIFLTDLFTVVNESDVIQPWLLSPSVCALLDIQSKVDEHHKEEKKEDKKIDLSSFKQNSDWSKDWEKSLQSKYGVSFDKIPEEMQNFFAGDFSATVFSVIIEVVYESIVVKLFVVLKQKRLPDGSITYDVIKIYQV